ncbi:MAG: SDR family oxidoreductase [Pseudomonadota bacterium]
MKVLVTGHQGYIGSALVPRLVDAGFEVHGLDSQLFSECEFSARDIAIGEMRSDIRDVEAEHVEGFDAVVHLAGLSNDPLGDLDANVTMDINHSGSVRLARLAKAVGVRRFVFASTCSVYGLAGEELANEDTLPRPLTPYARAKLAAEDQIKALTSRAFETVCLRFATAYGESPMLRFDLVVNNLMAWALATGEVRLKSRGTAWRPLVHVQAIAESILCSLREDARLVSGATVNVGDPNGNLQVVEIAARIKGVVPGSHLSFAPDASPDKRSYKVDFARMKEVLPSFEYCWDFEAMLDRLHQKLLESRIPWEDFEGRRFDRCAHLKMLIDRHRIDGDFRFLGQSRAADPNDEISHA